MNYVGKIFSGVRGFYNEINSATLTGAIDIVVVEQEDGSLLCSPFHVRFGKMGVLRSREKVVDISVNGVSVPDLHMKLGEAGEAFFVEELDDSTEIPIHLATSPLPAYDELMSMGVHELRNKCKNDVKRKVSAVERPTSPPIVELPRRMSDSASLTTSSSMVGRETSRAEFLPIKSDAGGYALSPKPSRLDVVAHNAALVDEDSDSGPGPDESRSARQQHRAQKKRKYRAKTKELAKSQNQETTEGVFVMDLTSQDDDVTPTVARVSLPSAVENRMDRTGEWASTTHFTSAFHPFSDSDLTPIPSPSNSRPRSPQSDTELDRLRGQSQSSIVDVEEEVRWPWGELPDAGVIAKVRVSDGGPPDASREQGAKAEAEKKDMMKILLKSNQKHYQRLTPQPKIPVQASEGGMYLDQLNKEDLDPELAALYLYQAKSSSHQLRPVKDEDSESGRGASLPQSPVSLEGTKSSDEAEHEQQPHQPHQQLQTSEQQLKAKIGITEDNSHSATSTEIDMSLCGRLMDEHGKIPHDLFLQCMISYDDFVQNPQLVNNPDLVIRIGDKFYNWQVAGPFILSLCVFQRPLPLVALESLVKTYMPKKEESKRRAYSWFSWRRATPQDPTAGLDEKQKATSELTCDVSTISSPGSTPPQTPAVSSPVKKDEETSSEAETENSDKENNLRKYHVTHCTRDKYKKVVRLTSDQLESLNLREGRNEVTFSVTTALQGTTRCTSHIYKWRYNDKIVVSDIDGTITKSDVLGQILPMVGKDWSQTGVAQLFSKIALNGYRFLYLSARAIGQSTITRDYLRSIRQGELMLPDGPLLLSPSSLISAFHREVIERKPEEFKISCLRDIAALFPDTNPFYAGFGNKVNDVWAYRATGIPISRIFTINPRGELRHELTHTFQSSYTSLSDVSDHFFPAISDGPQLRHKLYAPDSYSTFTYWRAELPVIDTEIDDFLSS